MSLTLILASVTAMAEAPRNGGRGNGAGGGSMQTLNEGIAYMNGDGVDQDYEKALQLFMEAFEAGSMKAARYVGMVYEQGLGVEQDYEKAAEYYASFYEFTTSRIVVGSSRFQSIPIGIGGIHLTFGFLSGNTACRGPDQ